MHIMDVGYSEQSDRELAQALTGALQHLDDSNLDSLDSTGHNMNGNSNGNSNGNGTTGNSASASLESFEEETLTLSLSLSSPQKIRPEDVLADFTILISSLSMEPLSAHDVLERVENRSLEVVTRYLPCVEFLVLCQQELRNALEMATQRRGGRGRGCMMNTRQVCSMYLI